MIDCRLRQRDNTYSNYQEAQRAFWRATVLPLVNRMTKAVSGWLSPAYGGGIALKPDLDQVEGLAAEREAHFCLPAFGRTGQAQCRDVPDGEREARCGGLRARRCRRRNER